MSARRWLLGNALGWLLGVVLVVILALAFETIGTSNQSIVGLGMGAGVGLMQAWALGEHIEDRARWVWASALGMLVPFVGWDLAAIFDLAEFMSLPLCVAIGAPLVGAVQARCFRSPRRAWWVGLSLLGWALPVTAVALGDWTALPLWLRIGCSFGGMFGGGLLYGVITAKPLSSLLRA